MESPLQQGDSSRRIDSVAVIARAQALKRAAAAGQTPRLLAGKNLALMLASETPDADLFRKADTPPLLSVRVSPLKAMTRLPAQSIAPLSALALCPHLPETG